MDIFNLLSYINKISLIAFFITTLVVGYQIYILKKEKIKEETPTIPDFKEKNNYKATFNYTILPSYLTEKKLKEVNYSKPIFITISSLTIIIVIFVISLIKKNNIARKEVLNKAVPTIMKPKDQPTPKLKKSLLPLPTKITPTEITPTKITPTETVPTETVPTETVPIVDSQPTAVPTEIILAKNPTLTPAIPSAGATTTNPQVLPETGNLGKGLFIIAVAISTIFFSFWF